MLSLLMPGGPDSAALESDLRRHLRGEVRFDDGSRALYATDGSNYRQIPIGVVIPRDNDDVIAAVAICREHAAPLLCRGKWQRRRLRRRCRVELRRRWEFDDNWNRRWRRERGCHRRSGPRREDGGGDRIQVRRS